MRCVILLFGPAGAGKTTTARTAPPDFTIYDRDDPPWRHHTERHFRHAIAQLAHNPQAKAIIIRAGATSSARAAATKPGSPASTTTMPAHPGPDGTPSSTVKQP